jgi:hypothetical protein
LAPLGCAAAAAHTVFFGHRSCQLHKLKNTSDSGVGV